MAKDHDHDILVPSGETITGAAVPAKRGGVSLLETVTRGGISIPRKHREQRAFFKFVRKATSNRKLVDTIHSLRSSLLLSAVKRRNEGHDGGVTIALSGVHGGEGTSFLTLLLALSLGNCSHLRTAVLDGRFNLQRFHALADVLGLSRNSVSLSKGSSQVMGYYNENQPNVYFLKNAGDEGHLEFFSDKQLGRFVGRLRSEFDFTIIDMPPLIKETSNVFLAPTVDHLYLVAAADKSRTADLAKCVQTAKDAGAHVAGVILNCQKVPLWARFFWREFFF